MFVVFKRSLVLSPHFSKSKPGEPRGNTFNISIERQAEMISNLLEGSILHLSAMYITTIL